jgi:hypothetical protein
MTNKEDEVVVKDDDVKKNHHVKCIKHLPIDIKCMLKYEELKEKALDINFRFQD